MALSPSSRATALASRGLARSCRSRCARIASSASSKLQASEAGGATGTCRLKCACSDSPKQGGRSQLSDLCVMHTSKTHSHSCLHGQKASSRQHAAQRPGGAAEAQALHTAPPPLVFPL